MQRLTKPYPPEDCFIVFENLGGAHFVKRVLNDMGYSLEAAHTGHGAMRQIASANLKTGPIDAYKLALAAKDLWMGRRYIRTAHPSSDENMRAKALCRIVAECAEIGDETDLRIKEYIPLHNIEVPAGYKHMWTEGSTKSLLERNDPALTIMVNMLNHAISQIDHAEERLEEIYRDYDGVRMLRSIKGIAARTAAYILTAIDGEWRLVRLTGKDMDVLTDLGLVPKVITVKNPRGRPRKRP